MSTEPELLAEVTALWIATFNQPPPIKDDPSVMLDVLLGALPEERYSVLRRFEFPAKQR